MEQFKIIRIFTLIISVLICLVSWQGLVSPEIYDRETDLWAAQTIEQDMINLYIVPFYLLCSFRITRKHNYFALIWTGITSYFVYTFFIYCFDIQFNRLFILYVLILGFSVYSLFFLFYTYGDKIRVSHKQSLQYRITGGYFILIAVLFCEAWLSIIIPANLLNQVPENLEQLPTNPVHVLDLAIVLPGIFLGGILLIRKKKLGYLLAPVILTFSLLMQMTIVLLMLFLNDHGLNTPAGFIWLTFSMALISLTLLLFNFKANHADIYEQ